jgi:hypothetical protein
MRHPEAGPEDQTRYPNWVLESKWEDAVEDCFDCEEIMEIMGFEELSNEKVIELYRKLRARIEGRIK